jgi:nicotinic acid mononucleotide adenylyltransferase
VSEYERELFEHIARSTGDSQPRIGSIDLVTFLLDKHPDTRFTLLVGADAYADLLAGKWKRGDELQRLVDLLVVDRVGVWAPSRTPPPQAQVTERVTFLNVPTLNDGSSTKVRELIDEEELASYVSPSVVGYMKRHKLYAFAPDEEAE